MHIAVIGTGYVGLVTGACFAEFGVDVTCVDIDAENHARLSAGEMPIYEPGLEQLVTKNVQSGRLIFTTDIKQAVEQALVIFLAVGTPPKSDGSPDLSFVEAAARSIADHMNGYKVIVTKSTVPIGTGEYLRKLIRERQKSRLNFGIVSNPEFLREGSAIEDFFHPDRIVIGVELDEAASRMREIYRPVLEQTFQCPVHESCAIRKTPAWIVTDTNSAELIKHASNSFLAMKISFVNMVADLCEAVGARSATRCASPPRRWARTSPRSLSEWGWIHGSVPPS